MKDLKFICVQPNEEIEIWKPVKGFENFYEVSNLGNIQTIERVVTLPTHSYLKSKKLLTQFVDGRGYKHVKLYNGFGKPKSITTHRIVLSTFEENTDDLPEVNHKDGNKLNNRLDNLEWSTRSYNIKHSYSIRDVSSYSGEGSTSSKLKEIDVIAIREQYKQKKKTQVSLAKEYGTRATNINMIVNRKTWKHV